MTITRLILWIVVALWVVLASFTVAEAKQVSSVVQHLNILASKEFAGRKADSDGYRKAQQYIFAALENDLPTFNHHFSFDYGFSEHVGQNIYAVKKGNVFADKFIVITAHYDHLGTKGGKVYYGADDNASGVSVLLELAHYFAHQYTRYSMVFLATDAEEKGMHGAKAFLNDAVIDPNQIVLNVNLDMLGYGKKQRELIIAGTKPFPFLKPIVNSANKSVPVPFRFQETVQSNVVSTKKQRIQLLRSSDHYPFYLQDIPFLMVTGENHHRYHTDKDKADKIDPMFFEKANNSVNRLVVALDQFLITI
ncbi:M28 family peptidase [Thalassotalea sp. HSM 43]|uniref:M28 family peptidase n=1 Tax=Thalassotalea sp. HSM 43 TaxID=2552945 RepID=UPI00167B67B3|nr:M28 family peptidase [Thalassotalea sp. HSM 43]